MMTQVAWERKRMETRLLRGALGDGGEADWLAPAAQALLREEVVAFPTETVYGLGALWRSPRALREVFRIKGRPQDNPLILHVADAVMAWELASEVPEAGRKLAEAFWPGPLTLILPAARTVPREVTAGLSTVGLRCPAHPLAQALIRLCAEPLAAPSANISGRPSPTTAVDVLEDLNGRVPYVIEGGASDVGLESTIVDLSEPGEAVILRPGAITQEALQAVLDEAALSCLVTETDYVEGELPRAPGTKYRHYAPRAQVHVLRALEPEAAMAEVSDWVRARLTETEGPVGLYLDASLCGEMPPQALDEASRQRIQIITFPNDDQGREAAHGLFAAFRSFDRLGCRAIACSAIPEVGYGVAYMNRLLKAASN